MKTFGYRPAPDSPRLAFDTLKRWAKNRPFAPHSGTSVTLFNDTFTNHYDPESASPQWKFLKPAVVRERSSAGCCGARPHSLSRRRLGIAQHAAPRAGPASRSPARGELISPREPSCSPAVKRRCRPARFSERPAAKSAVKYAAGLPASWKKSSSSSRFALAPPPENSSSRPLPSKISGPAIPPPWRCSRHPRRQRRRSRCGMLRHGRLIRLYARHYERVGSHRRTPPPPRRPKMQPGDPS